MKILMCSPVSGVVGGIVKWTNHFIEYNKQHKNPNIDIEYFDFSRKINGQKISNRIVKAYRAFVDYSRLIFDAKKQIERYEGDIIHITTPASFLLVKDIILLKIARQRGLKSILHFHFGRIPDLFAQKNWEYKLLVRALALADKVIVIDNKSHETLTRAGYKNIKFLPNPLTPAIGTIIRENASIVRQERKIVFAGHVIPTKGVFELVEACKQIPDIKVRMLGFVSDEMRSQLRQAAGENSETWLDIVGEQNYETTITEMLSAGVFVLPTYTEGFPNVILESMACACPIVTTNVGAIPEMLDIAHGFNHGICVKPKDVEGLKTAIEKMLCQRNYALQCGLNARKRVAEQYSMPIVWDKLTGIWKSLNN